MTIHIIPRKTSNLQHLTTSHSLTEQLTWAHLLGLHPPSLRIYPPSHVFLQHIHGGKPGVVAHHIGHVVAFPSSPQYQGTALLDLVLQHHPALEAWGKPMGFKDTKPWKAMGFKHHWGCWNTSLASRLKF